MATFQVKAHWDTDAGVWWAEATISPGLVAEAETHAALVADLRAIIPELVALNLPDMSAQDLSFALVSDQIEELRAA